MDMTQHIRDLEDQDESVRIAVKALGDMRNSAVRSDGSRTLSPASPSYVPNSPTSLSSSPMASSSSQIPAATPAENTNSPPGLVSRMSHLPLVGSALWAYEQGKASSRVVKYGAEMVESSVKTLSRPVIDRLPVNQIDQFACRQLDKLDKYRSPSAGGSERPPSPLSSDALSPISDRAGDPRDDTSPNFSRVSSSRQADTGGSSVPSWLEATSPFVAPPPSPPDTRSVTPTQTSSGRSPSKNNSEQREVAQRSRWQAVFLEAGGLSAALSEDSMRRLKYCLQWLQYATAHIDAQILILRDFIASLHPLPSESLSANRRPPISEEHMRRLTDVRRDVVHTIRQVVDVVSKYAGGALPEPAKNRVRGFILGLPQRWASKAGTAGVNITVSTGERERGGFTSGVGGTVAAAATGTGAAARRGQQRRAAQRERGTGAEGAFRSSPSSRAPSPSASSSPRISRAILNGNGGDAEREKTGGNGGVSEGSAIIAAQRILTLATESLDMMRNVTGVVKDSLDRADAWVGRLRTVGIQRGGQEGEDTEAINLESRPSSESGFHEQLRHRRDISTQSSSLSITDEAEMPISPVLSGSSSTNWASSIPSTPGRSYSSGSFASMYANTGRNGDPGVIQPGGMGENESLPVELRQMSLSGAGVGNDGDRDEVSAWKVEDREGEVKVVGVDVDEERKMDVDI